MKGKFVYANGLNISQSKKVCMYAFGDFFFKIEKNDKKLRFDIYIRKTVTNLENEKLEVEDCVDVDYFNKFWNPEENNPKFNLLFLNTEST